jgi:uncharacterized metal-binding protein YceD (DUF177 family)
VSKPIFVLPVADLERGPQKVNWAIPEGWLREVLSESSATPRGDGKLLLELSKNGQEVVVRGGAHVSIEMPCVVTLDPLPLELEPDIFLMLAPSPSARAATRPGRVRGGANGERAGRDRGKKDVGGWASDPELSPNAAAEDTYDGEKIVLDEFLREFILLELPMYPRRSDLPSEETAAIRAPSEDREPTAAPVDPRLLPLAAIASRLRDQKKD